MEHEWIWEPCGICCVNCGNVTTEDPPPTLGCVPAEADFPPDVEEIECLQTTEAEIARSIRNRQN